MKDLDMAPKAGPPGPQGPAGKDGKDDYPEKPELGHPLKARLLQLAHEQAPELA
jgi:hypothetical protein